jgi:hypothetical protein
VQSEQAPPGQNHRAWQWQYSAPGGAVVFDFQMSRRREELKTFLKEFKGILQTDAYGAMTRSSPNRCSTPAAGRIIPTRFLSGAIDGFSF